MTMNAGKKTRVWGGEDSQDSPKIHPPKVKLQIEGNALYIKRNNNSLFMFHPFTPIPPHAMPARVYVRVCVRGGETSNLQIRYFPARGPGDASGNSRAHRQS